MPTARFSGRADSVPAAMITLGCTDPITPIRNAEVSGQSTAPPVTSPAIMAMVPSMNIVIWPTRLAKPPPSRIAGTLPQVARVITTAIKAGLSPRPVSSDGV